MNNLLNTDLKKIWHPFTPLQGAEPPLFIQSAEGVYLITDDGRKIMDAVSSWWVNLHGHAHPDIARAIAEQASKLEHVIFAGFTHEPAIKLSENLLSLLPDNQSRVFFSDNGSTAVEVALKMAFQFWHNQGIQQHTVIAIRGAYHGDTFGSMSVGERGLFTDPFSRFLFRTVFIDFPEKGREQETYDQFVSIVNRGAPAVFIFEPLVQAAGGMRMYDAGLLDQLIAYAQKHDVICIADEVFTGFGRTGRYFASDYLQHKPDIIALSKGLTGGALPLGVTSCSSRIVSAFESDNFAHTFFHGHSYTANPIACAAANASLELLKKDECRKNIQRIGEQHHAFKQRIETHPNILDVRHLGTIIALELKTDGGTSYASDLRKQIYPYFLNKNILLRPLGNVIYIVPPYVISNEQLNLIYAEIETFLD